MIYALDMPDVDARSLEPFPRTHGIVRQGQKNYTAIYEASPVHGQEGQVGPRDGWEAQGWHYHEVPSNCNRVCGLGPFSKMPRTCLEVSLRYLVPED